MKKVTALLLTTALAVSLVGCGATNGSSKDSSKVYNIGICQLMQHPALNAATKGFKDALKKKLGKRVKFDLQNASGDSANCSSICNQFVSSQDDLIMANGTSALQAAVSSTNSIPILGTSVTDYATALGMKKWTGVTGSNVSGASDLAPLDRQAKMIQELFPKVKKIGILYCSAEPNSKYQSTEIQKDLKEMGYTCKEYTFADSNDVAAVTKNACADSDLIYVPTDNTAANCADAINNVATPAKVPIIAGEEGICKKCGVATLSINYYDLGYKTGEMAYDVLVKKKDISKMQVQLTKKLTYEYIAAKAKAFGVTIPSNYTAITPDKAK